MTQSQAASDGGVLATTWEAVRAHVPNLGAALALLLIGWLIAHLVRIWAARLITGLDRLARKTPFKREVEESKVDRFASEVVGRLAFWVVFLLFVAAAGESLGLRVASSALTGLSAYLPNVVGAIVVVVVGLVFGRFARTTILRTAVAAGISRAESLGNGARFTVVAVAAVIAIDQLGIDSTLLIVGAGVSLGAIIGSIGLAFGLGARVAVSNIVAAHQLAQVYRTGQRVRIGEVQGQIAEIRSMGVLIDTVDGRSFVPAREFLERASTRLAQAD